MAFTPAYYICFSINISDFPKNVKEKIFCPSHKNIPTARSLGARTAVGKKINVLPNSNYSR